MGTWRLGKYEIVARLGRGGMAEVYRAYHASLDRDVAIKVLRPSLASDQALQHRLEREARHIARLRHRNIVQVYDFEADASNGSWYMVMEHIDGLTLKDMLAYAAAEQSHIPLNEAMWIIREVLAALAYAHAQGMIHRDVKPANLIFDQSAEARVVLADFGVAQMAAAGGSSSTGSMVGTPAYSAPEQGLGEAGDERSDLYSVGVVLFELLTGHLPYDGETPMEIILKHVHAPVPSIATECADAPLELDAIVQRLLAKEPGERYASAQQAIDDIDHVRSLLPPADHDWLAVAALYRPVAEAEAADDLPGFSSPDTLRDTPPLPEANLQQTPERARLRPGCVLQALLLLLLAALAGAAALLLPPGGLLAPETQVVITATQRATIVPSQTVAARVETPAPALAAPAQTRSASSVPSATAEETAPPTATASATATATAPPSATPTLTPSASPTVTATLTTVPSQTWTSSPEPSTPTQEMAVFVAPPPTETTDPCEYGYHIIRQNRPDGELVAANVVYEREIVVQNTGLCAWPSNSALVFVSGSSLNATPPYVFLRGGLGVGESVTILFRGRAPEVNGLHAGWWALFTDTRAAIGAPFEISIAVYGGRDP